MSHSTIKDGTGSGNVAKVDSDNRIHAHAISLTMGQNASSRGLAYNINTGTINLTSANKSMILYIKNTGDLDLHIFSVGFLLGNSAGGTGDLTLHIDKNPTGGTLISGAAAPNTNENKNAGSNVALDADVYAGTEGSTSTGGTQDFYTSLLPSAARPYVITTGDIVLPRGTSVSIGVTPQTSNASMNVQVFLAINIIDDK